jgi:16S rRNA G527 N7-methylase RsmG
VKQLSELNQQEFDKVKAAVEKLTETQRDSLDAISRGFGKMLSNMYWSEHAVLEGIGVVKLRKSRSYRFHDVEVTPLGQQALDYIHEIMEAE